MAVRPSPRLDGADDQTRKKRAMASIGVRALRSHDERTDGFTCGTDEAPDDQMERILNI